MLPANIVNALQALAKSAKPTLSLGNTPPATVATLEPGQQLQGSVQSRLADGLFKVQIAGQTLQMHLPGNIQSGDTIRLQVISVQPRITFSMMASTNPIPTAEQIGASARMLSNLADLPIERPLVQQLGDKAVWAAAQQAPDAKQLASGLHEALSKSGLFYESHQAQWVRGERSIGQLLEEPQNLLTGITQSRNDSPAAMQSQSAALSPSKAGEMLPQIAREVLPLVQQQLHTLENHHVVWMGQVWPGQQMQWEIQGEPEHHGGQQEERQWSTEMELSLPRLGDVHARLVFAENGLRLTLHAADTTTAELFNRALPQLRESLNDAGIALSSAMVAKP